jgi:photosystem II stability/assembly factor-like uncharacterized protein
VIVETPPRAPEADELEALMKEARRRARRRRAGYALAVLVASGAAAALFSIFSGGSPPKQGRSGAGQGQQAMLAQEVQRIERAARRSTIGDSGLMAPGFGWAMNGIGIWLTQDGGRRWRAIAPPHVLAIGDPVARIEQVQFVDRTHGWISASDVIGGIVPPGHASLRHMEIDRTVDGGRTWRWSIPPGCASVCGGAYLSFLDARHGYVLAYSQPWPGPRLYQTSDGGAAWKLVARPPFGGPIVFVDDRDGFGARAGVLYRSVDGGRHWRRVHLPDTPQYASQPRTVDAPKFFGRRDGVIAVRFRDPASRAQHLVIYVTRDGGETWSPRPAPRAADLRAYSWGFSGGSIPFSAASPDDWVLLIGRTLYVTADAGRTWSLVHPRYAPEPPKIWDVDFTSRSNGWAIFAVRNGIALVHTTNGGRDWTPLSPPVPKLRPVHVRPACGSACTRP